MTVLGFPLDVVGWVFLLCSCAGVVVEGVFCLATTRRLELRLGLLYLPLRPLYGVGGTACAVLLTPLLDHPVVVLVLSAVLCSVVEFVSGWVVERAFGTISWDYSEKWCHLRGRICLQYSLCWGLLATAALYAARPVLADAVARPEPRPGATLLAVLLVLTLLSAVLTVAALARARRRVDASRLPTGEGPVPAAWWEELVDRLVPDAVLVHSLPRMVLSAELRALTPPRERVGGGVTSSRGPRPEAAGGPARPVPDGPGTRRGGRRFGVGA